MRKKYILSLLLSLALFNFMACDNDDDKDITIDVPTGSIDVDNENIELKRGESLEVNILDGMGNYRIFSLNTDIATATIDSDNSTTLEIKGHKYGKTQVVIADKETNLKTIPIRVRDYSEIKLDKNSIEIEGAYPLQIDIEVNILESNGDVRAIIPDDLILHNVELKDNKFTAVTYLNKSVASEIIFIDESLIETTFAITANVSFKPPYTEEEYEILLSDSNIRYYSGRQEEDYVSQNGSTINETEGDIHTYGWKYSLDNPWGGEKIEFIKKISFKGDKTVGMKEEGKIVQTNYMGNQSTNDLVHFEIMKVEDGKIWCFYSFLSMYGTLEFGHFVDNVNP